MSAEAIARVFEFTTSKDVAAAAGTTQRSVNRARAAGHVPRGTRGERMAVAMEALCAGSVTAEDILRRAEPAPAAAPGGTGGGLDEMDLQVMRNKRLEDMRIARLNRERKEADNRQAFGELVPVAEVTARFQAAGVEFQRGHEVLRRDVESRCCEGCRGPVVEALDEGYQAIRGRVGQALGGGDGA